MATQGIKNRIFGSDIPTHIKQKIEARQRLAKQKLDPNTEIQDSDYGDSYTIDQTGKFNTAGEENAIWCDANGAVNLYFDASSTPK